jgi:hypothetical protein
MRLVTLGLVIALVLPLAANAGVDWTSCGACGTIDSSSAGIYAYSNDGVSYNSTGSTATLEARYNVVDVDGSNSPGWTTLEIGYDTVTATSTITAYLYAVKPSTNNRTLVCSVTSSTTQSTNTCTFTALDFSTNIYYVQVAINRASSAQFPTLDTLRIF